MMDKSIPDKSYFRIGEVSRLLGVQPYVIRYWESEFKTVRPIRTRSDQRLYRHRDVEELLTIRKLLYEENFTINGARKQLQRMRVRRRSRDGIRVKGFWMKSRRGCAGSGKS